MRKLGITNVLFWALDKAAADILHAYDIAVYFNPSLYSSAEYEHYHSQNYIKMMFERPRFWKLIMKTGTNMLFLDIDIAVISDPMAELVGDADLEGQIDEFDLRVAKDLHAYPQMCGGAFYLKSNERSIQFLDQLGATLAGGSGGVVDDQEAINLIIHNYTAARILNRSKGKDDIEVPFGGVSSGDDDNRLTVRYIPINRFLNGHIWRRAVQTQVGKFDKSKSGTIMAFTPENLQEEFVPALIHLNGITNKEGILRRYGWWHLKDDLTCPLS